MVTLLRHNPLPHRQFPSVVDARENLKATKKTHMEGTDTSVATRSQSKKFNIIAKGNDLENSSLFAGTVGGRKQNCDDILKVVVLGEYNDFLHCSP